MREFKNEPSLFVKLTNFALIAAQSAEATSYISTYVRSLRKTVIKWINCNYARFGYF